MSVVPSRLTFVAFFAFALTAGCGWWRAETARNQSYEQQLDAYAIPKPIEEVWKHVREPSGDFAQHIWDGRTWTDTGPFTMVSSRTKDTRKSSDGMITTEYTWYECEALRVAGGTRVHYTRWREETTQQPGQAPSSPSRVSDRDVRLEVELVKAVDPAAGARIQAAAEGAAQRAK